MDYRWTYSGLLKEVETWKNVGGTLTQTIVRYTYDESGTGLLYIREVVGGTKTRFHWEGYDLYLEEVQSGTTWNSKYAYMNQPSAIGSTVARFDLGANYTLDSTDTYYFYHYDEAGNVILITDKNGNVVDHFEQDAWGNDLNNTFNTARSIAQHQTSKFYDTTTGLYFFGARLYYPEIGRFISVSPLSLIAEEDYAYCSSDPVNLVDLDGKIPIPLIIGAGYILFEWGLAVYDSYDTLATVIDPNQSFTAKTIAVSLFVAGALLPGGGYSKADDIAEGGLQIYKWDKTSKMIACGGIDFSKSAARKGDRWLYLPYLRNPKADWKQNAGKLRSEMRKGNPIYDLYLKADGSLAKSTGFLAAERNLLSSHGWKFDGKMGAWIPPK